MTFFQTGENKTWLIWLCIGCYVGVIYATLPFAPQVWFLLPPALTSFPAVASGVLGVVLAWVGSILVRRSRRNTRDFSVPKILIFILLAVASWGLILQVATAPAEIVHLLEYGGLGFLVGRALHLTRLVSWMALYGFGLVFLIGAGDEAIQYLLPNRYFEMRDVWLNAWCGAVGIIATQLLPRSSS